MTAKKSKKSSAKVGSATTSRTGQKGADATTVTPVEKANDEAKVASKQQPNNEPQTARTGDGTASKEGAKEAPARAGHAVGVPRKSVEAKSGPKNPDVAETARRQAAVGGI